jgi:hypothetical protein
MFPFYFVFYSFILFLRNPKSVDAHPIGAQYECCAERAYVLSLKNILPALIIRRYKEFFHAVYERQYVSECLQAELTRTNKCRCAALWFCAQAPHYLFAFYSCSTAKHRLREIHVIIEETSDVTP